MKIPFKMRYNNSSFPFKMDLPNLSGTSDNKEVNLSKMSGLGPRKDFGGSKNPELNPKVEKEDTAE